MNIEKINNEVVSPALKEITISLNNIINRIQKENISYQQGAVEIIGHKHLIQTIALDWMFNKKKKDINQLENK